MRWSRRGLGWALSKLCLYQVESLLALDVIPQTLVRSPPLGLPLPCFIVLGKLLCFSHVCVECLVLFGNCDLHWNLQVHAERHLGVLPWPPYAMGAVWAPEAEKLTEPRGRQRVNGESRSDFGLSPAVPLGWMFFISPFGAKEYPALLWRVETMS